MTSKRTTGKTSSIPLSLAIGTGAGVLVMLMAAALGALAAAQEWIHEDAITIVSVVITALAAAIAASTSASLAGKRKLQIALLSGAVLFLILLACNAMFFDGQYRGVGRSAIVIIATCASVSLLTIRKGNAGKKHVGKRAYR